MANAASFFVLFPILTFITVTCLASHHMLSYIRTFYASLEPWICHAHFVGHLHHHPFRVCLPFTTYIAPLPVSHGTPSTSSSLPFISKLRQHSSVFMVAFARLSRHNMGGQASNQLTLANALEIAKANQNGQIPPAVTQILERNIGDIWRRIQAQPSTYILKKEEFAVFSYYRSRYDNNAVAQQAVARFWNHYQGDTPRTDGARSSSSTPGPSSPRAQGSSGGR